MLLYNKVAIIYGGGGLLSGTIARAFGEAGATVFVTGRTQDKVQKVADDIIASGGKAEAAVVDALDENAVNKYVEYVVNKAGRLDISFNLIGVLAPPNVPMATLSTEDFMYPVTNAVKTQFITSKPAAKVMMEQRSGLILSLTNTAAGTVYPMLGGCGTALAAMEAFSKNLACEVGTYGVRAVNIRSGGSPDSGPFINAAALIGEEAAKGVIDKLSADTMLKKMPLMATIASVAVFLASNMAASITGTTIDVTSGTTGALNYKANYIKSEEGNAAGV